jgi:hypothetical protein
MYYKMQELVVTMTDLEALVKYARELSRNSLDPLHNSIGTDRTAITRDFEFVMQRIRDIGYADIAERLQSEHRLRVKLFDEQNRTNYNVGRKHREEDDDD